MSDVGELDWHDAAACRGRGASDFFDADAVAQARATCAGCPVRPECLRFAVENDIAFGVWGGLTPVERLHVRASRTSAA